MSQNAITMMDLALAGYLLLAFLLLICLIPVIEKMEKVIFSWLEKKIRRLKNPDPDLLNWKNRSRSSSGAGPLKRRSLARCVGLGYHGKEEPPYKKNTG